MSDFVKKIIAAQIRFEGANELDKFVRFFCDLYRIEIFKDGLDLILTKLQENDLHLEVRIVKGWDTDDGCYVTETSKIFNQVIGKFFHKIDKKIILKNFSHSIMAHEMAHALAFESEINLGEEFRQCVALDMKGREAQMVPLRAQIKRLMVDALKSYKEDKLLSELFARYFELLATSRDVHGVGDFTSAEVMDFFANTTNFITKIFNPEIKNLIDPQISKASEAILARVRLEGPEKKFQDSAGSFYKKPGEDGKKSWSKNVKSNARYQIGWQEYQKIEDKSDKNNN